MGATERRRVARAAAFYDLGVSYSTGTGGKPIDLIEAHKWFNLAVGSGALGARAAEARAATAAVMDPGEITAAQRVARCWRAAHSGA